MGSVLDRRDRRYSVDIPATIVTRRGDASVTTGDVSYRGAFLRTASPPGKRQLVSVRFEPGPDLADGGPVMTMTAMVVHVNAKGEGASRAAGFGVEFYGLDGELRRRWEQLIDRIHARQPASDQAPGCPAEGASEATTRRYKEIEVALEAAPRMPGGEPEAFDAVGSAPQDIASGGMFVRTEEPVGVGEGVILRFVDPATKRTFSVESVVRRRIFGSEPGLGVEFLGMTEERWDALVGFLGPSSVRRAVSSPAGTLPRASASPRSP